MGRGSVAPTLSVREITHADVPRIAEYWLHADAGFLRGMGVDLEKMPTHDQWLQMLGEQVGQAYTDRKSYCLVWLLDGEPVGHSNVNKIVYGEEAYMHLHIWAPEVRKQGLGVAFAKLTLPYFFKNLHLQKLYCEPYALNPAPNKALEKIGFSFVKSYTTTPGWINFEQEVNLWVMLNE